MSAEETSWRRQFIRGVGGSFTRSLLQWSLCPLAIGKTIYVDDDAPAPSDGSSWAGAYKYLQDALTAAELMEKPIEIHVAQGTYWPDRGSKYPSGTRDREAIFHLIDKVTIHGGFAGVGTPDPNVRNMELYRTVLSGDLAQNDGALASPSDARDHVSRRDNSYHVMGFNEKRRTRGGLTTELDGLAIMSGYAFRHRSDYSTPWIGTPDQNCGGGLFIANFPGVNLQPVMVEVTISRLYFREQLR